MWGMGGGGGEGRGAREGEIATMIGDFFIMHVVTILPLWIVILKIVKSPAFQTTSRFLFSLHKFKVEAI